MVWELPEAFQEFASFPDTFLRVAVAEVWVADRPAEELKVAVMAVDHVLKEQAAVHNALAPGGGRSRPASSIP